MKFIKFIGSVITYIQNHFKAMLFFLILFLVFGNLKERDLRPPNLATVKIEDQIIDVEKSLNKIERLERDDRIKGVLLIIDSPGGALAPSVELSMAVKRLNEKKPVIAYALGSMTSGSYYAGIWSKKIIANPGAFIGSIGVLFQTPNIKELTDKIGIKEQIITAGAYKQMGTYTREWTPKERAALKELIDSAYKMFINDVAKARGLNPKDYKKFADAKVFIAKKAKEVGLIDEVGSLHRAKEELIRECNITNPIWQRPDKMEQFLNEIKTVTKSYVTSFLNSSLR